MLIDPLKFKEKFRDLLAFVLYFISFILAGVSATFAYYFVKLIILNSRALPLPYVLFLTLTLIVPSVIGVIIFGTFTILFIYYLFLKKESILQSIKLASNTTFVSLLTNTKAYGGIITLFIVLFTASQSVISYNNYVLQQVPSLKITGYSILNENLSLTIENLKNFPITIKTEKSSTFILLPKSQRTISFPCNNVTKMYVCNSIISNRCLIYKIECNKTTKSLNIKGIGKAFILLE